MQTPLSETAYPLKFRALPKEKVWGGKKIAELFHLDSSASRPIGEAWVVWEGLCVENGDLRDRTLADLVRLEPRSILGSRLVSGRAQVPPGGLAFPLLVKILDARDTLSVQVHPPDAYAQEHEGEPFGKAEVWYVLEAEPGARLIHGVKEPVTRARAQQAIESGTLNEVLEYIEVSAGDVILNLPGTIHALGDGILLYELQQSSDLTYRLYDWDRRDPDRPLHIEKSLDVARLTPISKHKVDPVELADPGGTRAYLCACSYFAAELLTVQSRISERPQGICFHLLTVLEGKGLLRVAEPTAAEVELDGCESVLVPAVIDEYQLQAAAGGEPLVVMKSYVPDLEQDIVRPLRGRGISEESILQLGGDPDQSDLGPAIEPE
jgi:mannose-6-phosphate isomerase